MNKFFKSVFLLLALVSAQSSTAMSLKTKTDIIDGCAILGALIGCYCVFPIEKEARQHIQVVRNEYKKKKAILDKNPVANAAAIDAARRHRNEEVAEAEAEFRLSFVSASVLGLAGGGLVGLGIISIIAGANKVAAEFKR